MFSTTDTIVAIATPPGRGGIGVVRLSGPRALDVAQSLTGRTHALEPRRATLTRVGSRASEGEARGFDAIDHAVVTYFPGPESYTGEDVVEISAHGSPVILRSLVAGALAAGARAAEPGEFTLRGFLNGRIDLTQAEAIADLIDAVTPLQARAAFDQLQGTLTVAIAGVDARLFDLVAKLEASIDFPDEGFHFIERGGLVAELDEVGVSLGALLADARRGRIVREGLQVVIVGPPNVGKSSLFNALVGSPRAIVTDVPGTTRDLVTETIDLEGMPVTLVDTAGLRESHDLVEAEGVRRSIGARQVADLVLVVRDVSRPLDEDGSIEADRAAVLVACKADRPALWARADAVSVSTVTGEGLANLRRRMIDRLGFGPIASDRPAITNVRHIALLERARGALGGAASALRENLALSEEFVLADLQAARAALEEVTGRRTPDDVLAHIFERFCVGK